MKTNRASLLCFAVAMLGLLMEGCTAVKSFGLVARAGDTVTLALGYQPELIRENIRVVITDANSIQTVYPPGDPHIRALFVNYPDVISNLYVGPRTGQPNIQNSKAGAATSFIDSAVTYGDKDYSQSFLVLDLPPTMAAGTATIELTDASQNPIPNPSIYNTNINPFVVEVVPGAGQSNSLATQEGIDVNTYIRAPERSPHYTVTLQGGSTVPAAIDIVLAHDGDLDNGGVGRAFVGSPRSDIKSTVWNDDGFNLHVVMVPSSGQPPSDIQQFKFYVAGGLTGLMVSSVQAYDINGGGIPGVTATVTP
jgi:hypothetical protein